MKESEAEISQTKNVEPPPRAGRRWLVATTILIVVGLVLLATIKGPGITHPKFLRNLHYKSKGWTKMPGTSGKGSMEIFAIEESESVAKKAMDAAYKGKSDWGDIGWLSGYAYIPPGKKLTDAETGLILVPGQTDSVGVETLIGTANKNAKGCTLFVVYLDKFTLWQRMRMWLFEG